MSLGDKKQSTGGRKDPCLLEYWYITQREAICEGFASRSWEENIAICEGLARQSLFTMKLAKSPLFRAELLLLLSRTEGAWRNIRKQMGRFAQKLKEYGGIEPSLDYHSILRSHIINSANLQASNFMTWGIMMFPSPLKMNQQIARDLTNLLGACQEKGMSTKIFPILTCVLEMLVNKALDHMVFNDPNNDEGSTDFFMHHKIRYTIEHLEPTIADWLFSERGASDSLDQFSASIDLYFITQYMQDMEQICELIEDLSDISLEIIAEKDVNDFMALILHIFWESIPPIEQLKMINQWPMAASFFELIDHCALVGLNGLEFVVNFGRDFDLHEQVETYLENRQVDIKDRFGENTYLKLVSDSKGGEALDAHKLLYVAAFWYEMGDIAHVSSLFGKLDSVDKDALKDSDARYYDGLKVFYHKNKGQWDEARRAITSVQAVAIEDQPYMHVQLALVSLLSGSEDQFLAEFDALCKKYTYGRDMMISEMRDLYWDVVAMKGIKYLFIIFDRLLARGNFDGPYYCIDFGHIAADLGFFDEGIEFFKRGLELGGNDKIRATLMNNIGSVLTDICKFDEAMTYLQESAKILPTNSRTYLNLGKVYAFLGEPIKAREACEKAQELVETSKASIAELTCTTYETSLHSLLPSFVINYHRLTSDDIKLQFKQGDRFFKQVFPANKDFHELASSILTHYGNGLELLYHQYLSHSFKKIVIERKNAGKKTPTHLEPLFHNQHISLGAWGRILSDMIKTPSAGHYKNFQLALAPYTQEDRSALQEAASVMKDWRNLSNHGEIINFDAVQRIRGSIVSAINKAIEILIR
jgi:tetratricopeptide (TPR) repeat protein